jgi:hypothetical protein
LIPKMKHPRRGFELDFFTSKKWREKELGG